MAARSKLVFYTVFQEAIRPTGLLGRIATDADFKTLMLQIFNRSYQVAWDLPAESGSTWEDATLCSEITPSSSLIAWSAISDSRAFEIWTSDPRQDATEQRVNFNTNADGILITDDTLTTVWMEWMPETVEFSYTAWATATAYVVGDVRMVNDAGSYYGRCYQCLTAHTSGTFATDLGAAKWVELPVLPVIKEFLIQYLNATYLKENAGQPETGIALQSDALARLLEKHRTELRRKREQP